VYFLRGWEPQGLGCATGSAGLSGAGLASSGVGAADLFR
jgi:hypothetical protein